MKTATIFNLQKFSIHDGPGFRTTVFFKGCALSCKWCANPESQKFAPELYQIESKCIGCGACIEACPNGALSPGKEQILVDRSKCVGCGTCTKECYAHALAMKGKVMDTDEVLFVISQDEKFYKNSGGGYTLSGGEPLLHADFCKELIEKCTEKGYHGCMETCGYGDTADFVELAGMLDLIYFDIKQLDPELHKKWTGVTNELILKNMDAIQDTAKEIIVRTPVIPAVNATEEDIRKIAEYCSTLKKVTALELLPYHRLGEHKYEALGQVYELAGTETPEKAVMAHFKEIADEILIPAGKRCDLNRSATG